MSIKFKSFHDYTTTHQSPGMFGCTYPEPIYATKQIEDFIKENNIKYSDIKEFSAIKDIKFSVDNKGNEHILLIYEGD